MLDKQTSDKPSKENANRPPSPDFLQEIEQSQARPLVPVTDNESGPAATTKPGPAADSGSAATTKPDPAAEAGSTATSKPAPEAESGQAGEDSQKNSEMVSPGRDETSSKFLDELMRDPKLLNKTINTYFRKVDADGDGHVTEKEANGAFLNGREKVIQDLIKGGGDLIQNQSNDEWGKEDDGATRDDIKAAFKNWMSNNHDAESASRVTDYLPAVFDEMDSDGDGFLSGKELDNSNVPDDKDFLTGLNRALAALELRENYDKIKDNYDDGRFNNLGISLSDIYASTDSFYKNQTQEQKDLDKHFVDLAS